MRRAVNQPHSSGTPLRRALSGDRLIPVALVTVAPPARPTATASDGQLPGPFTPAACERALSSRPASLARAHTLLFRLNAYVYGITR
jgi:hypothetical protein